MFLTTVMAVNDIYLFMEDYTYVSWYASLPNATVGADMSADGDIQL